MPTVKDHRVVLQSWFDCIGVKIRVMQPTVRGWGTQSHKLYIFEHNALSDIIAVQLNASLLYRRLALYPLLVGKCWHGGDRKRVLGGEKVFMS